MNNDFKGAKGGKRGEFCVKRKIESQGIGGRKGQKEKEERRQQRLRLWPELLSLL